jgi:rod shape determining protein RodA
LHIDPFLLWGVLILSVIGLAVLYSATGQDLGATGRQGLRMLFGMAIMLGIAHLVPRHFILFAPWLYLVGLLLLVVVAIIGTGKGAQRWLDLGVVRFQPSELMKVFVPMMVAWYLYRRPVPPRVRDVLVGALLVIVPAALVAEQPDLGTAALIAAAGLSVVFLSGVSWRLIGLAAAGLIACAPLLWYHMHEYQRQRLLTLIDPTQDPLGTGYHIIQSMIAVGSGGLYGKGWLNGTQSHLEFIPERSTDFIFAVLCEEFGFMGVVVVLSLYVALIGRGLHIALEAQDPFARLMAGSLTLTLFIYVLVNMGMVIGQLPVVGIPLPFISYGGTSLVTLLASFGILMSFQTHRRLLSG